MCGIAGFFTPTPRRGFGGELQKMAAVLTHRGPDSAGVRIESGCGLAAARLKVIDLTDAGRQPMPNEDESVWLAYNGEVYNFHDLKLRFGLHHDHQFRSRTDTEVLVHLYEELGLEFLEHLNGMYALALWDKKRRTLHLARDPFGIKPLFYTFQGSTLYFASELQALLEVDGISLAPDGDALRAYLGLGYIPGTLTPFQGIRELEPGTVLTVSADSGEKVFHRFHNFDSAVDETMSEADAIERCRSLLHSAVERQLVAEVPVGVMLSGGVDSSSVGALAARTRGDGGFHTFSLAFNDASHDESGYARLMARRLGADHHEVRVTPDHVHSALGACVRHMGEPMADSAPLPLYLLAEAAKEHVTVLLSGEGGDELFGGYTTYSAYEVRKLYRRLPQPVRSAIRAIVGKLPVSHRRLSFQFLAQRFVAGAELGVPESHFHWRRLLSPDQARSVLADPTSMDTSTAPELLFPAFFKSSSAPNELGRLMEIDRRYHLGDKLLPQTDRMTMAHSLEGRVPFCDLELARFLSSVPTSIKLKRGRKKHLLKEAVSDLLPARILSKKKLGLQLPVSSWLNGPLKGWAEQIIMSDRIGAGGLLSPASIRSLWAEHQAKKADHGYALWGLINYALWHETFIP